MSRRARQLGTVVGCLLLVGWCGSWVGTAAEAPVEVTLRIPPAKLRVIGDPILLIWRFENRSARPLAFMWEGCCRLNGRLEVSRDGRREAPRPPGQALAHLFAKAERLSPGTPSEFETFLHDWIELEETGTYRLQGYYTGVLPQQRPQVPRGLELWTNQAVTAPIEVSLLSVPDYLAKTPDLAAARAVRLRLKGPSAIPPLATPSMEVTIENLSPKTIRLNWPSDFQLWILSPSGRRLGALGRDGLGVSGATEELVLGAGETLVKEFPFRSDLLEEFGDYRVFIELEENPAGEARVPSNPLVTRWHWTREELIALLEKAAQGPRSGFRNAALKLLRVHLGEIGAELKAAAARGLPESVRELAEQLWLASLLKSMAPEPGRVAWKVRMDAEGKWEFESPVIRECLGELRRTGATEPIARLLDLRRHLGWEVAFELQPDGEATLGAIQGVVSELARWQSGLAERPGVSPKLPGTEAAGKVFFVEGSATGNAILRMAVRDGRSTAGWATGTKLRSEDAGRLNFREWKGAESLKEIVAAAAGATPQIVVVAAPEIRWNDFVKQVASILEKGFDVEVDI